MNTKLLFKVIFFQFNIFIILGQKSCNLKEIDLCISNYMFGQNAIPINQLQLQKLCSTSRELETCLTTYFKRCFSNLQTEMIKWIGTSLTKPFMDRCNSPIDSQLRKEVFKYAPCLNSITKEQRKCYDLMRLPLEYIFTQRYDRRVPIGCCAAHKTIHCVRSLAEKNCDKSHADFIATFYPLEEFLEAICEGYELESEICAKNQLPIGWSPDPNAKSVLTRMMSVYFGI